MTNKINWNTPNKEHAKNIVILLNCSSIIIKLKGRDKKVKTFNTGLNYNTPEAVKKQLEFIEDFEEGIFNYINIIKK